MQRIKSIKQMVVLVFIILTGVIGLVYAFLFGARIPFEFEDFQVESNYLVTKQTYSEYFVVEGYETDLGSDNPVVIDADTATVYLDDVQQFNGRIPDLSFIRAGKDVVTFEQLQQAIAQQSCGNQNYRSGAIAGSTYLIATCDIDLPGGESNRFSYYLYSQETQEGLNWILFVTPDGEEALGTIIEEYKAPRS